MAETHVNTVVAESKVPPTTEHYVDDAEETIHALQNERQLTLRDTFKLYPKAIMFSFIISLAVIMEGYDTNLMGNFYPFPEFKNRFGDEVDPEGGRLVSARWQTILSNATQVRPEAQCRSQRKLTVVIGWIHPGTFPQWHHFRAVRI
jgi:MFS transporter, SP family, general alpha glucoside:H+ symporter